MIKFFQRIPLLFSLLKELKHSRNEYFRFVLFLLIAGLISIIALIFFLSITSKLNQTIWFGFDYYVNEYVHSYRSAGFTNTVVFVTNMGSIYAYILIIPLIMGILYFNGKKWKIPLQSAIVLLSSFLLNIAIKWIIGRPRPFEGQRLIDASFYSYPSGHSMSATGFYGFLIYLVIKYVKNVWLKITLVTLLSSLILSIGMSRVYLGVHYPTDVLAGFVAGTSWLLVCMITFKIVNFYRWKSSDSNTNQ